MEQNASYPFDGEWFPAQRKRFQETVFFVHFYKGSKRNLHRHIKLANDLGFDAFAFNLYDSEMSFKLWKIPFSASGKIGLKHVYASQVEHLLNLIPGKKIIYSFSNPSASAIESMARRFCSDTIAMICDSGPSARFEESFNNMAKTDYKISNWLLRKISLTVLTPFWSALAHKDLISDLNVFPKGFKILSIRGWKDHLISPLQIDEVFEPHTQLDWRKLSLPEAGHLNGLKDFSSEYIPIVESFLLEVATPLSSQT